MTRMLVKREVRMILKDGSSSQHHIQKKLKIVTKFLDFFGIYLQIGVIMRNLLKEIKARTVSYTDNNA